MENNEQLALKILKHDNEERYSSSLSQSGYFKIKKGIHTNIIILPDYANQVVLRYKLKKVLRQLKDYFKNLSGKIGCTLTQIYIIERIDEKINQICAMRKDTEYMNKIIQSVVDVLDSNILYGDKDILSLKNFSTDDNNLLKFCVLKLADIEHTQSQDL